MTEAPSSRANAKAYASNNAYNNANASAGNNIVVVKNQSLQRYNTLGLNQRAEYFVEVHDEAQLVSALELAREHSWPVFILGGGSNLVLTHDIAGLVIHPSSPAIHYQPSGTQRETLVTAWAGTDWHTLVIDSLAHDLPGLENLSLIPGSVGAAPVQNIGAYGVELKDRLVSVRALCMKTRQWLQLDKSDCDFSYRDSFFKQQPNRYIISEVTFKLGSCNPLDYSYGSLADHLRQRNISTPNAQQISQSVVAVRQSRLPDPSELGNAGSFFHNPVIDAEQAAHLQQRFPEIVTFKAEEKRTKISAAWMIEHLGYKGYRVGDVGVHEKQALVLVNYGAASGEELLKLASDIQQAVQQRFGIELRIEPIVL